MCLFAPFILQNYKKIFKSRSRVLRTRAHNNPFTLNKIFFAKTTNINFICPLAPFIVRNVKKPLEGPSALEYSIILGPKCPTNPNQILFWKTH